VLLGPAAVRQARKFSDELPTVLQRLTELPIIGHRLAEADVPAQIEQWLQDLPARVGGNDAAIERVVNAVVGGALAAFFTLLVTVVVLLDGERVVRLLRRLVPVPQRARADRAGQVLYRTVGRYFAGSIFLALLNGIALLATGTALGLPLMPVAAIWATVTNLIPQVGGFLGGSFFVMLGFSQSPTKGVLALAFFLLYQQIENHVLMPTIVGVAVDLSPPITMMAALIGGATLGVPGALMAVPLIGAAKAIAGELRPNPGGEPRAQPPPLHQRIAHLWPRR